MSSGTRRDRERWCCVWTATFSWKFSLSRLPRSPDSLDELEADRGAVSLTFGVAGCFLVGVHCRRSATPTGPETVGGVIPSRPDAYRCCSLVRCSSAWLTLSLPLQMTSLTGSDDVTMIESLSRLVKHYSTVAKSDPPIHLSRRRHGRTDGWMDVWTDKQTGEKTDRYTEKTLRAEPFSW